MSAMKEYGFHDVYTVHGGKKLSGEIRPNGAKNAATKQLVASLLTDGVCEFSNIPKNDDVLVTLEMLKEIGSEYEWTAPDKIRIQTKSIKSSIIREKYSGANRVPILLLGPLLHRVKSAEIPMLGGCTIGPRPIDFHQDLLKSMGATFECRDDRFVVQTEKLYGNIVQLPYPSVGATENAILSATLSEGVTVIFNAAIEPEIIDTVLLLQKMGALIQVDADRKIIIDGVKKLNGVYHRVIPDRIEAASFAVVAIITAGEIKILDAKQEHLISFLNSLRRIGGGYSVEDDGIVFFREREILSPLHLETDVFPGFATDWQPPLVALLTQADGVSVIHETVYENRFGYTHALNTMGARIDLTNSCLGSKSCRFVNRNYMHSCIIQGKTPLQGKSLRIPDLRAGFAYIAAALCAKGTSEISGISYLERGYSNILHKLLEIGAEVEAK